MRAKDSAALAEWFAGPGRGVDPNPRNDEGQTPLYWACEVDDPFLAQVLIDNGADVAAAEAFGFTPLHLAAYLGHVNLTRVLVNAGASGTTTNNEGSTPLHLAAKQDHVAVAQLLVAAGKVDLLAKDGEGNTPIQLAPKGSACFDFLRDKLLEMKRVRDNGSSVAAAAPVAAAVAPAAVAPASPAAPAASAGTTEQLEKMQKAIKLLTTNIESERARVAELEQRLAQETVRSTELLQKGGLSLCAKCKTMMRDRVFLPCMHFYYCGECAKGMASCEACGTQITGKVPAKLE